MSIYDRDYMRFKPRRRSWSEYYGQTPVVRFLIIANIIAFVLSVIAPSVFVDFSLSPDSVKSFMGWTFVSYAFLHGGFLHILFNMLGLYFLGTPVEKWLGSKKFLALFFLGAVGGALVWLGFSWNENSVLIGASAGVMAVLAYFCVFYPPVPLTFLIFFVLPVRLKPMTLLKVITAIEVFGLLFSLSNGGSDIAYSAHLGGLGVGIAFAELIKRGKLDFIDRICLPRPAILNSWKKRAGAQTYKFKIDVPSDFSLRVDKILEKINKEGFASLTQEERDFLKRVNNR